MEETPWARQPDEPLLWFRRFERFRLMEPNRSIAAIFQQEELAKNREKPRTKPTGDWYEQAQKFQWEERAAAWDASVLEDLEKQVKAEQAKILLTGYALRHQRVIALNSLAEKLLEELKDEDKLWLPDAKTVAGLPFDLRRFNAPLIQELRATLADLAAEMGERVKKKEIAVTELPANLYLGGFDPDQDGVEDREPETEDEEDDDVVEGDEEEDQA